MAGSTQGVSQRLLRQTGRLAPIYLNAGCFVNNAIIPQILQSRPEKFYCTDFFSQQSHFLNAECNTQRLVNFIVSNYSRLDSALKILSDINKKPWNDSNIPTDEYEFFRFCEQELNPSYLLLLEGVFGVFIHVNSVLNCIKREKSTDGLDIYNRVEELKETDLAFIIKPYCNTIRNSIAHGNIKSPLIFLDLLLSMWVISNMLGIKHDWNKKYGSTADYAKQDDVQFVMGVKIWF